MKLSAGVSEEHAQGPDLGLDSPAPHKEHAYDTTLGSWRQEDQKFNNTLHYIKRQNLG